MPKRFVLEKLLDAARKRTGERGATSVVESFAPTPPHRNRLAPIACTPMCRNLYRVIAIVPERAHLEGCAICRDCGTVWCPWVP